MFYDKDRFPFLHPLEDHWQKVLAELQHLRDQDFIPWPEKYLYGEGWETFALVGFGVKLKKNCQLCPETTRLLDGIPNLVSAGFSALASGTHIAPHTGYADGVLRCHLGLVVPPGGGIRVADQIRTWEVGKCLVFDDTSEHEAWNKGEQTRVVLLIDFKAPPGVLPLPEPAPVGKGFLQRLFGQK